MVAELGIGCPCSVICIKSANYDKKTKKFGTYLHCAGAVRPESRA